MSSHAVPAVPTTAGPTAAPASRGAAPGRSHLRVVAARPRWRARTPFVVIVACLLGLGLAGLLLLNTTLAEGAYVVHDLEGRSAELSDRRAQLAQEVAVAATPQRLAQRAQSLGMVPSENPAFIRAADGAILGVPTPGATPPAPAAGDRP